MYGYLIDNTGSLISAEKASDNVLLRETVVEQWHIRQTTLRKFLDDKLFFDDERYFLSTEGVLLNIDELQQQYQITDYAHLLLHLYEQQGDTFVSALRGSFAVVLYDKRQEKLLVYTDQQGSKPLFYYQSGEHIVLSSSLFSLASQAHLTTFDEASMLELLSLGYLATCRTILKGVMRVQAGHFLSIANNRCEEKQYHQFTINHKQRSPQDEIEGLDHLFRQAVERVIRKDNQYGYEHFIPLSGGLDSRMIVFAAAEADSPHLHTFSYSQSGTNDELLAAQVAQALNIDFTFMPLDGGDFLIAVDESVFKTDAQIVFAGPAESLFALKQLPADTIGIMPTGVGGDNVVHSLFHRVYKHYDFADFALSPIRYNAHYDVPADYLNRYPNRNIHSLYTRIFYCHNFGAPLMYQSAAESYSVYMDVDLMNFLLSVPEEHRKDYRLYDKWVISRYPQAAQISHNGHTIGKREKTIEIFYRTMTLTELPHRLWTFIKKKLGILSAGKQEAGKSPNPNEQWLETNRSLSDSWNKLYDESIGYLNAYPLVRLKTEQQFRSSLPQLRMQALTLLSAVKQLTEIL